MALSKIGLDGKKVIARIERASAQKRSSVEIHVSLYLERDPSTLPDEPISDPSVVHPSFTSCYFVVPKELHEQFFSIDAISAEGTNHIKQGYLFLKTQPMFQGWEDA